MRALTLIALTGCGRIGFSELASTDAATTDVAPDAVRSVCPPALSVPDPLTISGQTYRYTNYDGTHVSVGTVQVTALANGTQVDQVTSSAAGNYTVTLPTSGTATDVLLQYDKAGEYQTRLVPGVALDRSFTGASSMLWEIGDAPVWNDAQMMTIYSSLSVPRDNTRGTLNVAIRTCAGASIAGVTVQIDPPPDAIGYTRATGNGITTTSTQLPASHAVAFNARPGPTLITATAQGLTFPSITVDVASGMVTTLTILHPYE